MQIDPSASRKKSRVGLVNIVKRIRNERVALPKDILARDRGQQQRKYILNDDITRNPYSSNTNYYDMRRTQENRSRKTLDTAEIGVSLVASEEECTAMYRIGKEHSGDIRCE